MEQTEQNKALVMRFAHAQAEHQLDLLDDLMTPDFVRHCQASPGAEETNLEQFKQFLDADRASVPDARITPKFLVAEGDLVAVYGVYGGTQRGAWGPLPPTNRYFEVDFTAWFRIASGKIAELWVTWDNVTVLRQLGHQ